MNIEQDFLTIWQFVFYWYQRLIDLYSNYFITRLALDIIIVGFIISMISKFIHFKGEE